MSIYNNPSGNYQRFINAYAKQNGVGKSNQQIVDLGNNMWKDIKNDKDAIADYIKKATPNTQTNVPKKKQTSLLAMFKKVEPLQENADVTSHAGSAFLTKEVKSFPEACTSSINKHGFLVERDQTYVEEFFKSICPNFSETFISDKSVWGEPIFKTTCVTTANSWNVFNQLKCKYSKLSQKDRESNMKNNIKQIERVEDLIKESVVLIISINITASIGLEVLAKNCAQKKEQILNLTATLLELKSGVENKQLLINLRRRINQQLKTDGHNIDNPKCEVFLRCKNSSNLDWDTAFHYLIDCENSNITPNKSTHVLSNNELIRIATLLRDCSAVNAEELRFYLPVRYKKAIPFTVMNQLIIHLPIIYVSNNSQQDNKMKSGEFIINLHQLDFNCTELNEIFRIDNEDQNTQPNMPINGEEKSKKGKGGGRKGIEHLFPSLPDVATEFIKSQGFCAQGRRRTSTYMLWSICNSS